MEALCPSRTPRRFTVLREPIERATRWLLDWQSDEQLNSIQYRHQGAQGQPREAQVACQDFRIGARPEAGKKFWRNAFLA